MFTFWVILVRELATLLRVKPRALFKSLGGYQEKKKHRVVLSGVPYAFPNLGNVIVPFQVCILLSLSFSLGLTLSQKLQRKQPREMEVATDC